jgi:hypothetical protein
MKRFTKFKLNRNQLVGLLIIGSSVAVAYAGTVTLPNTFTAGTPAVADQVNANFTAVKNAVDDNNARFPTAWFHEDDNSTAYIDNTNVTIASLAITAPSDGIVLVNASTILDNAAASACTVRLRMRLDGATQNLFFPVGVILGANGTADLMTVALVDSVAVTAGAHTIDIQTSPSGCTNFSVIRPALSVVHYPAAQGSILRPGAGTAVSPVGSPEAVDPLFQ